MTANVITGGEAAAAFAGCVDCAFVRNTVVDPTRWLLRILQETVALDTYPVAPTSKGTIADNLFYFRRSDVSAGEDINVGDNTQSESFTLSGNVWFAHDEPRRSQPILPTYKGPRTEQIVGVEPTFVNAAAGDFRVPEGAAGFPPGAPASCEVGAGSAPD
jgi:hypothetical protein